MTVQALPHLSLRSLSKITGLDRDALVRRIEGVQPAGIRAGHPVYALGAVLLPLVRPVALSDNINIDPDKLTPSDRKSWFDSEIRRRQLQE